MGGMSPEHAQMRVREIRPSKVGEVAKNSDLSGPPSVALPKVDPGFTRAFEENRSKISDVLASLSERVLGSETSRKHNFVRSGMQPQSVSAENKNVSSATPNSNPPRNNTN